MMQNIGAFDAVAVGSLDFESLDAEQRAIAAKWEQNDKCMELELATIDAAIEAGEDLGMCMAETPHEHVKRRVRVKELVPREVAVSFSKFKQLFGSKRAFKPSYYSFLQAQHNIEGGEEVRTLVDLCKALQTTRISDILWPGHASSAEFDRASELTRASVREDGAALLRGVVPDLGLINRAKYLAWKGAHANSSFTEYVHATKHRHHLRLRPSEHPVVAGLFRVLVRSAAAILMPLVSQLGAVVEFAAFLTNPGAKGQHFHTDIIDSLKKRHAPVYSVFLFLTDIDQKHEGPLQIAPQSHALSHVRDATRQAALMLSGAMSGKDPQCLSHWKLLPVKSGDVAIYDGSVLHRGTMNNSTKTRIVVYLTVMGVGSAPEGKTFAIDDTLLEPPLRLEKLLEAVENQDDFGEASLADDHHTTEL